MGCVVSMSRVGTTQSIINRQYPPQVSVGGGDVDSGPGFRNMCRLTMLSFQSRTLSKFCESCCGCSMVVYQHCTVFIISSFISSVIVPTSHCPGEFINFAPPPTHTYFDTDNIMLGYLVVRAAVLLLFVVYRLSG